MAWIRFFPGPQVASKALRLILTAAVFAAAPLIAQAQATRTWVSGVGDDANPCSRTAPCKTFAGAIAKTAAGGEINALDPGGFGAVTITKAITLDGGAGQVASVLVSGTDGIVINASTSDNVILRNLSLNGVGSGLNGINLLQAQSLRLQNVKIDRFTQAGIRLAPSNTAAVQVINATVTNCAIGLSASTATTVSVDRSQFMFGSTSGVSASASGALVQMSNSIVFGNALGLSTSNSGVINSYGNNQTLGNTSNGSFSGTVSSN